MTSFKNPSTNSKTNLQDDFGALHIFKNKLQLHVYKQDSASQEEEHMNSETNGDEQFTLGNNTPQEECSLEEFKSKNDFKDDSQFEQHFEEQFLQNKNVVENVHEEI